MLMDSKKHRSLSGACQISKKVGGWLAADRMQFDQLKRREFR